MRPALRRLFLHAVTTDTEALPDASGWRTRCLHCRTRLHVDANGEPLGAASLEHVVPRAWFDKRAAAPLTARVGNAPDDARNLAIACTRCNHDKGKGPDARGPHDARAYKVVETLLTKRLARWRNLPPGEERLPSDRGGSAG
jgi:5-methylcytosine-specific restriction endonuclease McrA